MRQSEHSCPEPLARDQLGNEELLESHELLELLHLHLELVLLACLAVTIGGRFYLSIIIADLVYSRTVQILA